MNRKSDYMDKKIEASKAIAEGNPDISLYEKISDLTAENMKLRKEVYELKNQVLQFKRASIVLR